ncbi:MAG: hypothetical protein JXA42_20015 [Anaerolineales bacterium]|nr:hypothetical protein [Anaerolineales bacterium]
MKIMVFLHGTVIMHAGAVEKSRGERVRQVLDREKSITDLASYIPVGNAVNKLQAWRQQGAEIVYLSPHKRATELEIDRTVLRNHDFPQGRVYFRQDDEKYSDVAVRVLPDILIKDDCESIGGEKEVTLPQLEATFKARIKSIVVKEFGGVDHLPDDIFALLDC